MVELFRSTDLVLLSYVEALLKGEGLGVVILDHHTSVMEGSIAAIPRRAMIADEDASRARAVLRDVGIELPACGAARR